MERAIVTSRLALRMPSEPATEQDVALAQDLLDTLAAHANECVGLAANMVGVRRRVIAISDNGNNQAMLNPAILEKTAPYQTEEGCLSLPGRRGATRYQHIVVRWQDMNMNWRQKRFSGWTAQIIQHEIDHCDGILI